MFSKKLKDLRKSRDSMSQADLAGILGVTQQAVGRWEKDLNMPDFDTLKKIAEYFDVTTDYLLGNETEDKRKGYYLDNETAEIANALKEGDGMLRVMFDTVRKLPPEKMREAANYIEYLKAKQHPEE